MLRTWCRWIGWLIALVVLTSQPARGAGGSGGARLVTPQWLQAALAAGDVLVLDASPASKYAAGHIAGAVHADVLAHAGREVEPAAMERRLRAWGIGAGRRIVVMDQGGDYMAPRLFFDLYYLGLPEEQLHLLDGGLAGWRAAGGAITTERTPTPPTGSVRVGALREHARVRLDEFLVASGDPRRHALVDALEPGYFHGQAKFFDRGGHVPNAISLPAEDFFNADKTFKSAAEITRMAAYRGIHPGMTVHAHCGGGGAAAVPFFALRFLAGFPQVKLYNESQREWLMDGRGLPMWTYGNPSLWRSMGWLQGWNGGMLRAFGLAQLSVIDLRSPEAYARGHVPYAVHLPAEAFAGSWRQPTALAGALGAAGVHAGHEAVLVSDGGLTPRAALAFFALDQLGHQRVSLLMESMDDWGLAGHPLTKVPTTVGPRQSPQDLVVAATRYDVPTRIAPVAVAAPAYPQVVIHAGARAPTAGADGAQVHLPYRQLLTADGMPKPAAELLAILQRTGVPRHATVVVMADDPGEAAVVYVVLRLMGWPQVSVSAG